MITVENVLTWITSLSPTADNYYAGTLNSKKAKSFGVYQLKDTIPRDIALGNITKTAAKGVSILVHWTESTRATESAAQALYESLGSASNVQIGNHLVDYIKLLHNEPIDVGTDENGICERVIEFVIYYERS